MATHIFNVEMTCEGCSGAVTRILTKQLGDNDKFDIDLPNKKVAITSSRSKEELAEILKKSGKAVNYIGLQ